ncbi:MAG: Gfo/Idh/MocA family oxidoreductase [Verrucomicrobiales bacterium]|nr:Gfo/Idh/MocA family oxidoreductase [Verrucomicrobiales bacterium]
MKSKAILAPTSRRTFLHRAILAAATVQIVPGRVLGLRGETAPSNRLNIAGIGIGGQGGHDVGQFPNDNIVALCDVDWRHAAGTFKKFPQAQKFKDYREMLDTVKEIDAVVVGTPDHQHAFASMAAIRHGKHVYCEKPLTHSVWEARQVAEAARKAGLSTQMGNQGQASEETRRLCEIVWSGAIGKITEVHIWTDRPSRGLFDEYWPQGVGRPTDAPAVPAELDWNLWIGPAPMRPYHPIYAPFKWRGWWDFGTGALGDIGCHSFDPVFRALKLGAPSWVQASSSRVNEETFPLASMVTYQFPARSAEVQANNFQVLGMSGADAGAIEMPPVRLTWYDGGLRPPRPADLEEDEVLGDNGRLLVGTEGYILGSRVYPEKRRVEVGRVESKIPRVPQGAYAEWSECCKKSRRAGSHFDWAGPLAETVLLGNVALRVQLREKLTRSKLLWDTQKLEFTNLPEANAFLKRAYREGWSLG